MNGHFLQKSPLKILGSGLLVFQLEWTALLTFPATKRHGRKINKALSNRLITQWSSQKDIPAACRGHYCSITSQNPQTFISIQYCMLLLKIAIYCIMCSCTYVLIFNPGKSTPHSAWIDICHKCLLSAWNFNIQIICVFTASVLFSTQGCRLTTALTCRLSHISWLYVILWISVGELR